MSSSPDRAEVWPGRTMQDWDAIDEASWESFPASDPPASRVAAPAPSGIAEMRSNANGLRTLRTVIAEPAIEARGSSVAQPRGGSIEVGGAPGGLGIVTILGGVFVALIAATCLPLATVAVRSAPPLHVAGLRALVPGLVVLAFAAWWRRPQPRGRRQWLAVFGIGVAWTALGFGAMLFAGGRIAPGLATVIASTQPLLAAALGLAVLQERIDRWAAIGMALALAGITVAALTAPGHGATAGTSLAGAAFVFLGAAGVAAGNVLTKRFARELDTLSATGWQLVIGAVVLLIAAPLVAPHASIEWSLSFVLAVTALAAGTGVGFVIWFVLLRRAPLVTLNVLSFVAPIFGLAIGVTWFGERLGTVELAGIVLVVAGIALAVHPPGTARSPAWECRLAWVLRALLILSATIHIIQGEVLYALLCVTLTGLLVLPPVLARSSRANVPIELELFALLAIVGDMVLGRVLGLYETAWFDKLLHAGTSSLIGLAAFLIVYALRFTGRLRTSAIVDGFVIVLLAIGLGGLWEIAEYAVDALFGAASQGSPVMDPLDDTMWDLVADGVGGLAGAVFGTIYMRRSRRSAERIAAFARLVPVDRDDLGDRSD